MGSISYISIRVFNLLWEIVLEPSLTIIPTTFLCLNGADTICPTLISFIFSSIK